MTDLDVERETVERALAHSGTGWDAWPAVAATAAWTQRERLAALLLLLSTPERRVELGNGDHQLLPDPGDDVIDLLRRQPLPWDAATARLGLEAVAERGFDDRRVRVVLRAAECVCASGHADLHLLDELRAFSSWLDVHPHRYGLPEARQAVARALASAEPTMALDLSVVHDGDGWGAAAREAARRADTEAVAPLVRVLGELGHRLPASHWAERVRDALRPCEARQLLKDWLVLASEVEASAAYDAAGCPQPFLLTAGNEDVVRAAVLATRYLDDSRDRDGTWVPRVLGSLARRGPAACPAPPGAHGLTVAGAAVDTLAARGGKAERSVLSELFAELDRPDLVRRVGAALSSLPEVSAMTGGTEPGDSLLTRTRPDVRPDTRPRVRPAGRVREAVALLLIRHLVPTLRAAGFDGAGRTWRRRHPDRVDVVHLGTVGEDLALTYGVWFDAAHPSDHPHPQDRARLTCEDVDVRFRETWVAVPEELERCADHLAREVVPFLDTFGVYELAREHMLFGGAVPTGAQVLGTPSCPAHQEVLGLLALAVGDHATAVHVLGEWVARLGGAPEGGAGERTFWTARLEQATRLATGGTD